MARCSLLYDQMANNLAIGVAGLFQFRSSCSIELELCFDVEAFGLFFNRVCQVALAPRVDVTHFSAQGSDKRANPFDGPRRPLLRWLRRLGSTRFRSLSIATHSVCYEHVFIRTKRHGFDESRLYIRDAS